MLGEVQGGKKYYKYELLVRSGKKCAALWAW
jgi:hypothetical protein